MIVNRIVNITQQTKDKTMIKYLLSFIVAYTLMTILPKILLVSVFTFIVHKYI